MKSTFYNLIVLVAGSFMSLSAMGRQTTVITDTIYMGTGYNNEIYYNMSAGDKGDINRKQWDIAFRASRMSASILTNDAANNNVIGLSGVELYTYPNSDTSGWATVDTAGISTWKNMVNSTTDWEEGAFCRNQKGHPDYGWGKYNTATHNVVGDSLFIIKLRDGSLRKLWIIEKYSSDNIFKFRFANIDGTDDNTITLDCSPYTDKNFIGYSLTTKEAVDFEPVASSEWDILFTKYAYTYPDGTIYQVTGVLDNYGVKVNKFEGVPTDYRLFDLTTMDSTRSPIGWEWKTYDFANNVYTVDTAVYFVQDKGGNIHRLVFRAFAGTTSGMIVFDKEMISATGINEIAGSAVNVAVYPNPVADRMNLVLNPGKSRNVAVSLNDLSGRTVFNQPYELPSETLSTISIPVSDLKSGMYIVRIQVGSSTVSRKVLVTN
jgi:hypothetical protein